MVKSAGKGNCEERGDEGGQPCGGRDCRAGHCDVAVHHHDLVDDVHHPVDALHVGARHVSTHPVPLGVVLCGVRSLSLVTGRGE